MSFELLARLERLEQRVTYLEARLSAKDKPAAPTSPSRATLHLPAKKAS